MCLLYNSYRGLPDLTPPILPPLVNQTLRKNLFQLLYATCFLLLEYFFLFLLLLHERNIFSSYKTLGRLQLPSVAFPTDRFLSLQFFKKKVEELLLELKHCLLGIIRTSLPEHFASSLANICHPGNLAKVTTTPRRWLSVPPHSFNVLTNGVQTNGG